MKKTVLIYGLIAGLIASAGMGISLLIGVDHMDSVWGMVLGFTGMIIAFAFIFVAITRYRDRINNGSISFGKAFVIGLCISLIASSMYVVVWMVEYKYVFPDFMEKYSAQTIENMKNDGAKAAEIEETTADMAKFKEDYKNPVYRAAVTYSEILPLGILASVLAAAILRRQKQIHMDI
jgi:hypothetical protein